MKSLTYLNKYLFKYRWRLLAGIFFIVVSNLFALYPAKVTRQAIDFASQAKEVYMNISDEAQKSIVLSGYSKELFFFLLLILGSVLLKGIFMFFMRQTIIVMSRLVEFDLKNEIFEHYQNLDTAFYKRNNTGDLMARISEDVSQVRMYLGPAIMYTINLVIMFVMCIVAMVSVNVELTVYVLAPMPILAFGIYYVSNIINKKSDKVQKQISAISTFVQETFSGIRVIKSFSREDSVAERFDKESDKYRSLSLDLVKTDALFQPLIVMLVGLSTILSIYIGGQKAMAGEITFGNIAEFIMYVNMLTWPVASVGWVTSLVQRAAASQARINDFLHTEPGISNTQNKNIEIHGNITFDKVSFVYPDSGIHALKDVSFHVKAGQSLAILGKTGSGKSTIANLVARMYDEFKGDIKIDEHSIRHFDLHELRSAIGFVPQDVFLFSETIANNIAFGVEKPLTDDEIKLAARQADILSNIQDLPEGFNTMVGERGITLSGGQKQRISLARAILRKPKILVLDDCLSAVDTETEENILNHLKTVMENRTTIIISHRVSSVIHANQIIYLENGMVAEQGTHADLLLKKGLYYNLYHEQLLQGQPGTV